MKSSSSATKPIMIILCILVILYFIARIAMSLFSTTNTVSVYSYKSEDITTVSGYIIRGESVLPDTSSILDITRSEGERVGAGQTVAMAYGNQDAVDRQKNLAALQMQLSQLQYAQNASVSSAAGVKLDSSIVADIMTLQANVASGKFSSLDSGISELESLVLKRDYTYTDAADLTAQIADISSKISALKTSASSDTKRITVSQSGIYSAVVDGYENILTVDIVDTIMPSTLSAMKPDSAVSSAVGKLITQNSWYYAANMDAATADTYKVGSTVALRFAKDVNIDLKMTVYRVSDKEDGQKTVLFYCDEYLSQVTLLRHQTADIVHESYTGLRVPTESIRVEDGVSGVYCLVGLQAYFKPVEVVYKGDGYYLVTAAKNSDNTENTGTTSLRIGDEVLITTQSLYNGKVIES